MWKWIALAAGIYGMLCMWQVVAPGSPEPPPGWREQSQPPGDRTPPEGWDRNDHFRGGPSDKMPPPPEMR